jgi:hypothetical protein
LADRLIGNNSKRECSRAQLAKLLESLRQVLLEALEFNLLEMMEAAGPRSQELALSP